MAAAFKVCGEPGIDDLQGQLRPNNAGAHGHHIRIVVLAAKPGAHQVRQQRAADALDLIGRDADADARRAKDDALFTRAAGDGPGRCCAKIRVVSAIGGIGAKILAGDAPFFQMALDSQFQVQRAVVTCKCDHSFLLLLSQ